MKFIQKRALPGFHFRSKIPRSGPYNLALTAYLRRTYLALIALLGGGRSSRFRENAPGIIYIVYNTREMRVLQDYESNFVQKARPENEGK